MSTPGDRYRRLLRLHPAGPDKDDLLATLLALAKERGEPTRREIAGVAVLALRRRVRARAYIVVAAAVALLLAIGGVAVAIRPAARSLAEVRCDRDAAKVIAEQRKLAESVFPPGAYDVIGQGGDCRDGTRNLDLSLYLEPGWHRAQAEAVLQQHGWMLGPSTNAYSGWMTDGFSVEVRGPAADSWDRHTVVTFHKI
jgi:hypothetical protein